MRILWLSHLVPYPPKGGVLQRAYYMLREIAKYHDIDLLAFNQPALISPLYSSLDEGLDKAKAELGAICNSIKIFPITSEKFLYRRYLLATRSIFTKDPYTINWLKSREFESELKVCLLEKSYDLIHFDTISLMPYFDCISDTPSVLDHHNIESHMLFRRANNESNILKKLYFHQEGKRLQRYEEDICPRVSMNITCSKIDADRLESIAPTCRVQEIANGVDLNYFMPDENAIQVRSILFVGTLSWYPNIEAVRFIAYEIWPALQSVIPNIKVDIVGANPPDDILKLASNNVNFNVHGFVEDVRPYFDRAAVYVCPIKDGGGTKLKILDALAMKKAIVAHPIAFEGISVTDGKNVLFANNTNEYIEAIKCLIENDELRTSIGRHARELVESRYSYNNIGLQLSELFEGCVRG
jgi:glycosyltransferase involved in cell wall biosynthesis